MSWRDITIKARASSGLDVCGFTKSPAIKKRNLEASASGILSVVHM